MCFDFDASRALWAQMDRPRDAFRPIRLLCFKTRNPSYNTLREENFAVFAVFPKHREIKFPRIKKETSTREIYKIDKPQN